jgi:transketolase
MREAFIDKLFELRQKDPSIFFITGDLGFSVLEKFQSIFPSSFLNSGIAEQNMTLIAAGLAMTGKKVITYSIGNFNSLRVIEQIRNNICYNNLDVKIVSIGAGFAYGQLGFTHHLTEDIGIMKSLPNMVVFSPADDYETKRVTELAISHKGPCYIRLGKGKELNIHDSNLNFSINEALNILDGKKIAFLATGNIIIEVRKAIEVLMVSFNLNPALYSFPVIKPMDTLSLKMIKEKFEIIITVEENMIISGFGSTVSNFLSENNFKGKFKMIGVRDIFMEVVGNHQYLLEKANLNSINIIKEAFNLING